MGIYKSCCELVFLSCKTTTFGLVTVADMLSNTTVDMELNQLKVNHCLQSNCSYRHAEISEMLYIHLMLFAIVNLRKYNKLN